MSSETLTLGDSQPIADVGKGHPGMAPKGPGQCGRPLGKQEAKTVAQTHPSTLRGGVGGDLLSGPHPRAEASSSPLPQHPEGGTCKDDSGCTPGKAERNAQGKVGLPATGHTTASSGCRPGSSVPSEPYSSRRVLGWGLQACNCTPSLGQIPRLCPLSRHPLRQVCGLQRQRADL